MNNKSKLQLQKRKVSQLQPLKMSSIKGGDLTYDTYYACPPTVPSNVINTNNTRGNTTTITTPPRR